ncbi:hypothetical protein CQW23_21193 [Capsicum baccatum]|uniref:RING-type E3 ubiquitin transferase n=1 Tax=Capsicum baccatum TaxID=33114 RepID=A0A2G2VXB1_CAPBA|nr:hypothetical protein CQW23_21193 [Capsicum baccatum]
MQTKLSDDETMEQFLRRYFGFKHEFFGVVVAVTVAYAVIFAFTFALGIEISLHNLHCLDFWDNFLGSWCKSQDLFNAVGSMYAAFIFLGIHNLAIVQSVVAIERIVFYRERAAGMLSALPYTFGQAERLSRVRHSNLVTLIGIFSESRFLAYEFLKNVNLEDHLACHKKSRPVHWQHWIRIIVDICSVLIFIHANDPCTIHRNLRPTNILLDAKFVNKISDFGVHLLIS